VQAVNNVVPAYLWFKVWFPTYPDMAKH